MAFRCLSDRPGRKAGALPSRPGDRLSWAKSRPVLDVNQLYGEAVSPFEANPGLPSSFFGGPGGLSPRFT